VGFETTIPAFERAKTVHALDRVVTVIGTQTDIRLTIQEFGSYSTHPATEGSKYIILSIEEARGGINIAHYCCAIAFQGFCVSTAPALIYCRDVFT
jgi:hypothetical protein